jgi:transposase
MSGIPEATSIILTSEEWAELEGLARSTKTEHRMRQRARIALLAADGVKTRAIGRAVGCTTGTASKWRVRYAMKRFAGLDETGNRGADPKYGAETDKRILALLDQPLPKGYARWTGPLLAAALGDVDVQYVWRFLRAQKIDLSGRKSWCESNDPEFAAKAADVVGLYMAPPENAIVICVDEKPSIQALERAQGYLKLPNGRTLTGHSHDYKRNGTSTLFAAFEVATGKVTAAHKKRRRRVEFLDFMNDIVAVYPDTAIHVVLDNLNTHKPKNDRWLKRHANVQSTSRRRGLPGSTKWRSGSPSCKESLCTAPHSPRSTNSGSTSMPSSRHTTKTPSRSSGPNPRSTKNASNLVSRISDSGY